MKTNDHRVRVTKSLIKQAFLELYKNNTIQNISIKELCAHAQINRGTFYSHYHDIYSLLEEIEDDLIKDFAVLLNPLLTIKNPDAAILVSKPIFEYLKNNFDICFIMLGENGDKKFVEKLIGICRDIYIKSYVNIYGKEKKSLINYYYTFISGGCVKIIEQWLIEGMTTPAKEIAVLVQNIINYGSMVLEK